MSPSCLPSSDAAGWQPVFRIKAGSYYGFEWASHPQMVKIALTACTLVMAFGALFSAWQTPFGYCTWLWLSAVFILAV